VSLNISRFASPPQIEGRIGRADDALDGGVVDGFDHGELAVTEAEGREGTRRGIAVHDPLVDAMREAGDYRIPLLAQSLFATETTSFPRTGTPGTPRAPRAI
jgi:hypothetical protein